MSIDIEGRFTERGLKLAVKKFSGISVGPFDDGPMDFVATNYAWSETVRSVRSQRAIAARSPTRKAAAAGRNVKTAAAKRSPKIGAHHVPIKYADKPRQGRISNSRTFASERPKSKLFENFKKEFVDFVCSESRKYADLRQQYADLGPTSQTGLVSLIGTYIGAHLGVGAGIASSMVALSLLTLIRLGRGTFCATYSKK